MSAGPVRAGSPLATPRRGSSGPRSDERADAVVVGAGLAGLTAAVRLAGAVGPGRKVLLLEAGSEAGGRARTTDHGGYLLGLGPRALYRTTERQLRALGVRVPGHEPDVAGALALRDGALHPGYAAALPLLRTGLLSARERVSVGRLLALSRPRARMAGTDAAQWLGDRLPTERARQAAFAVLRMSAYVGRSDMIGADALAGHFAEVRKGVRYVDGGWRSVVDALLGRAAALGVVVRTGARAASVEGGSTPYVRLADGRGIRARAVVVAGLSPRAAGALLERPGLAGSAGHPLHTACLDVALSRLPDPRRALVFGVDEPLYLSAFSTTARLAPPGGAVLHLARYDDGTGLGAEQVRARLHAMLDTCQPGWREVLVHERFLPRITTMSALPEARLGGLTGRPGPRAPGHPGVFLAGDWVGPHGLLADAVVLSAVRAAEEAAVRF
ncbi:phytoene desaturase family protein [Streptomyces sp. A5-4]|uniref:phytoene desaturase family protein n=1 Tax=Streptomyces sp. A5-4 TaxID=3384771 RepID=UPI003DA84A26